MSGIALIINGKTLDYDVDFTVPCPECGRKIKVHSGVGNCNACYDSDIDDD